MGAKKATVAIIGAGPIGIECAIALKKIGIDYLQFDKGQVGQMIANFPPETPFFSSSERISLAGFPIQTRSQQKCLREEYLTYLRTLVLGHRLTINSYEEVIDIEKTSRGFQLTTRSLKGALYYEVTFVIFAVGGTATPRLLGIPGEDMPHVTTKMHDPHTYFMKQLVVIGGRNSAAETALRCFHAGVKVTILHKNDGFNKERIKYWLYPELSSRIENGQINCFFNAEVKAITKQQVLYWNNKTNQEHAVEADFVIKCLGFNADMHLLEKLGIQLQGEEKKPVFDINSMETSQPGAYVLGTVIGGTQRRFLVYIENSHGHIGKILKSIMTKLELDLAPLNNLRWCQAEYIPKGPLEE